MSTLSFARGLVPLSLAALLISSCENDSPLSPDSSGAMFSSTASSLLLTGEPLDPSFAGISGSARIICVKQGTLYITHFSGLAPKALYTIWGFSSTGAGALGAPDGSENVFIASASGEGQLSLLVRPGPASFGGTWPLCALTDSPFQALILDGHTDNASHGGVPFPNNFDILLFEHEN